MEHKLGHGDCPACQRDNAIRIQEITRLRAVNAKLLAALDEIDAYASESAPYSDDLKESMDAIIEIARAAVEEAKK